MFLQRLRKERKNIQERSGKLQGSTFGREVDFFVEIIKLKQHVRLLLRTSVFCASLQGRPYCSAPFSH